ncbi:MAG: hypothetical protein GX555_10815 [Actinomycetales bacterium]|nr:hypothetical protein [Actinomycetales bacterium]
MQRDWTVEDLGTHTFLVHGTEHGDRVDVEVGLDPSFIDGLGLSGVPDEHIVDATVAYLLEHQRLDELPAEVDLEVVAAAYDDFADRLRTGLQAG